MTDSEPDDVYVMVVRSALDPRVWAPVIAHDDIDSVTMAGGLRAVKAWAEDRVQRRDPSKRFTWTRVDPDTWTLAPAAPANHR